MLVHCLERDDSESAGSSARFTFRTKISLCVRSTVWLEGMFHTILVCCLLTVVIADDDSPRTALPPNPDYCKATFCAQQLSFSPDARKWCEYYFDDTVLPSPSSDTRDDEGELLGTVEAGVVRVTTELSIRSLRDVRARVENCILYCDQAVIEVSVLIDFVQRIGDMIDSSVQAIRETRDLLRQLKSTR